MASTETEDGLRSIDASDGLRLPFRHVPAEGELRAAIVYLHGIQSHGGWYLETAAELSRRGYTMYLPDRRGSGVNPGPRGDFPSRAQLIDDVGRFVDLAREEQPDAPIFVVGGCWGARPAAGFALERQDELAGVALVCPAIRAKVDLRLGEKLTVVAGRFLSPQRRVRVPLEPEMFTSNPPYLEFIRNDPLALRQVSARFFFEQALWDRALLRQRSLRLPMLLLQAGRDPIVDAGPVRSWFERLVSPSKQYVLYPEFGHLLDFEPERQRYWNDLAGWLDAVVEGSPPRNET
jgi:acylglycerol lipase